VAAKHAHLSNVLPTSEITSTVAGWTFSSRDIEILHRDFIHQTLDSVRHQSEFGNLVLMWASLGIPQPVGFAFDGATRGAEFFYVGAVMAYTEVITIRNRPRNQRIRVATHQGLVDVIYHYGPIANLSRHQRRLEERMTASAESIARRNGHLWVLNAPRIPQQTGRTVTTIRGQ